MSSDSPDLKSDVPDTWDDEEFDNSSVLEVQKKAQEAIEAQKRAHEAAIAAANKSTHERKPSSIQPTKVILNNGQQVVPLKTTKACAREYSKKNEYKSTRQVNNEKFLAVAERLDAGSSDEEEYFGEDDNY
jgi:hypothetical protein